MPPKKRKSAASASAESPVVVLPRRKSHEELTLFTDEVNGTLLAKVARCLDDISQHPVFHGVEALDADNMGTGFATRAPFSEEACEQAFNTSNKKYPCAINLWSLIFLSLSSMPGVPISGSSIDGLTKYYFHEPAVLPFDIWACAESASDAQKLVSDKMIVICSHPEILFAYIFKVHSMLPSNDEDLLT